MSEHQDRLIYNHIKHDGYFPAKAGHYHNMYEIYFLKSGNCRYFIGDKLFEVNEGDIILISRGTIHKSIYSGSPIERYLLNFPENYIDDVLSEDVKNLFEKNIYHAPKDIIPQILSVFQKLSVECDDTDKYSDIITMGCMTELFTIMLRHPCEQTERDDISNLPVENATAYITEHYNEPLTLEGMAELTSLSVSYFSRLFKTITGFGFKEYLTIIRLKQAQSLLLHTDTSICKIAYECGFNDSNYFSVVFKDFTGISPLKYRKQNRIKKGE